MSAKPNRPSLGSLDSSRNRPLSSGQFEPMSNDLFTATFDRAAADHVTIRSEAVITHAVGMGVEIMGGFAGKIARGS